MIVVITRGFRTVLFGIPAYSPSSGWRSMIQRSKIAICLHGALCEDGDENKGRSDEY